MYVYFLGIFSFIPGLMLDDMPFTRMMSLAETPGYLWAILYRLSPDLTV